MLSFGAIQGLDKLLQQLEAIASFDEVRTLHKGAEQILPYMQSITPVDTGELRDSEQIVDRENSVELVAEAEHAPHVELGTSRMAARPFMRTAIQDKQDDALKAMADDLQAQIQEKI